MTGLIIFSDVLTYFFSHQNSHMFLFKSRQGHDPDNIRFKSYCKHVIKLLSQTRFKCLLNYHEMDFFVLWENSHGQKNLGLIGTRLEWTYARKIPLRKRFRFANVALPSPCHR